MRQDLIIAQKLSYVIMEASDSASMAAVDSIVAASTETSLFTTDAVPYVINSVPYFSSETPADGTQYVNLIRDGSVMSNGTQPSYIFTTGLEGGTNTIFLDASQLALLTQQAIPTAIYDGTSIFQLATTQELSEHPSVTITASDSFPKTVSLSENHESRDHDYSMREKGSKYQRLSKKLKEVNQDLNEILPPHKKGPFKCTECDKEFLKYKQLNRHIKKHDEEKPHKCDVCSAAFNFSSNLNLHMVTHCTSNPVCPICKKAFSRVASLKAHIMVHEVEEILTCQDCGEEFATQGLLNRHMKIHDETFKEQELDEDIEDGAARYLCKKCPKKFVKSSYFRQHMRKHRKLNMVLYSKHYRRDIDRSLFHHKCADCGKRFEKPSQLSRHCRIHTGERPFKCEICGRAFNQKGALQIHMTKHSGQKPHQCDFCPATFSQRGNLRAHVQRVHSLEDTDYKCHECSCVFRKAGSRNAHMRRVHGDSVETCESANKKVDSSETENYEINQQMNNVINQLLDIAKQTGKSPDQTKEQLSKIAETNNMNSDILQQALVNSGLTTSEVAQNNEEKSEALPSKAIMTVTDTETGNTKKHFVRKVGNICWYQCLYCHKEFKKVSDLVRHVRIHTHEKPYKCNQCFRAFAVKSTLKAHLSTHSGIKQFKCVICEKLFSSHGSLRVHMLLHSGVKPYACDICGKSYRTSGHRNSHRHIHEKESLSPKLKRSPKSKKSSISVKDIELPEPILITDDGFVQPISKNPTSVGEVSTDRRFRCHVCQRAFKKSSHLKQHSRSHTGEKPFQCGQCSRSFVSNGVLKSHLKTHTGVKPYKCDVCGSCFTTNGSLKRHLLTHTENRPYMCPYCQKTYKTSMHCRKHMKSHRHELAQNENSGVSVTIISDGQPIENLQPIGQLVADTNRQVADKHEPHILLAVDDNVITEEAEMETDVLSDQESILPDNMKSLQALDTHTLENPSVELNSSNFLNQTLSQLANGGFSEAQFSLQNDPLIGLNSAFTTTALPPENADGPVVSSVSEKNVIAIENKKKRVSKSQVDKEKKMFECGICSKAFKKFSHLKEHFRTHTKERSYQCKKCFQMFVSPSVLRSHMKTHEGTRNFLCDICSSTFTTKSSLNRHQMTHSKEKSYKCLPCNKEFPTKFLFNQHLGNHQFHKKLYKMAGEDDDDAVKNKKTFVVKRTGTAIQISEEETNDLAKQNPNDVDTVSEKILIASVAEKNRTSVIKIENQRQNEPKHPHECSYCGKSFKKPSDLVRHHRIHTGEKPFACKICGKQFTVKSTLDSHIKIHSGAKDFLCHVCNSSYSTKGSLKVHMRLHTGSRPYKCSHCEQRFRTSGHRQSHMASHRKSEGQNLKMMKLQEVFSRGLSFKEVEEVDDPIEAPLNENHIILDLPGENVQLDEQGSDAQTNSEGIQFQLTPGLLNQSFQITAVDPSLLSKPIQINAGLLQQFQQQININITISPSTSDQLNGIPLELSSTNLSGQNQTTKVNAGDTNTITLNPNMFLQQLGLANILKTDSPKVIANVTDQSQLGIVAENITCEVIPQDISKHMDDGQIVEETQLNQKDKLICKNMDSNDLHFVEAAIPDEKLLKQKNLPSKFICSLCQSIFTTKNALIDHGCDQSYKPLKSGKTHRCVFCELCFNEKKTLNAHLRHIHSIT